MKDKRAERAEILEDVDFLTTLSSKLTGKAEQCRRQYLAEEAERKTKLKPEVEQPPKTREELLQDDLRRKREQWLGIHDVAETARKEAREKHKDTPDLLERELAVIDQWEREWFEKEG